MKPSSWRSSSPMLAAAAAFIVVVSMTVGAPTMAARVLTAWGVLPFRFPFLDLDTVLSALRCRRLGIDVFATNPCDALGRVFDYSPLWLSLSVFPVTIDWLVPAGFAVDAAFLLSLLLLPPGRSAWQASVVTLCVLSTPVAFALERANNDLIIFVLAAGAAALAGGRLGWRVLGYAGALLAGMLKYFPLLLLGLMCRERLRVFVPLAASGLLLLVGFIVTEFEELNRALPLIPVGRYFGDMFGASTLPYGLANAAALPTLLARLGLLGLVLMSSVGAMSIASLASVGRDLARLTEGERLFLLAGALLILGCFFTAQNIGYRALHLVLAAPALTALATVGRHRALYRISVAVVLVLLWSEGWRHWLDAMLQQRAPWEELPLVVVDTPRLLGWLVREGCWWWTVTVLAGLSFAISLQTPVGRAALPSLAAALDPGASPGDGRGEKAAHGRVAPQQQESG